MSDLLQDSFYRFVRVESPPELAQKLEEVCSSAGLWGTILVASEGINGMLCGSQGGLQTVRDALEEDSRFSGLMYKRTSSSVQVFYRLRVRLKAEIVPLGIAGVDATRFRGTDVSPLEWRELLGREDVIVIDNRNSFEYTLGHFKGAINPGVNNFRDFAHFIDQNLPQWEDKTIAMYCTGGIRCEKTGAWLASRGIEILQLEGGILHYFQQMEDAEQDYDGTCFVFDARQELDTQCKVARTPRPPEFEGTVSQFLWRGMEPERDKVLSGVKDSGNIGNVVNDIFSDLARKVLFRPR